MNSQEREQLTRFLEQLAQAQPVQKDDEADALIRATCARQADAAYLLVQRAMRLDAAVLNSQCEIARLQREIEKARSQPPAAAGGSGFIDANAWGNSSPTLPTAAPQTPPAAPFAAAPAVANGAPAASAWGGSALGTIAGTAAGVVAGGFLFQGIGHLLANREAPVAPALASAQNDALSDAPSNTNLFDTSSVDDYIAGEDNS